MPSVFSVGAAHVRFAVPDGFNVDAAAGAVTVIANGPIVAPLAQSVAVMMMMFAVVPMLASGGVPVRASDAVVVVITGMAAVGTVALPEALGGTPEELEDPTEESSEGAVLMGTEGAQPINALVAKNMTGKKHPPDICAIPCIPSPFHLFNTLVPWGECAQYGVIHERPMDSPGPEQ